MYQVRKTLEYDINFGVVLLSNDEQYHYTIAMSWGKGELPYM